jgi:hypothetical protein
MEAVYVLNSLDGKRVSAIGYKSREAAKVERNTLKQSGKVCVVSRGPDHPAGPSRPDPRCLNTEMTSRKRRHRKKMDLHTE